MILKLNEIGLTYLFSQEKNTIHIEIRYRPEKVNIITSRGAECERNEKDYQII